MDELHNILNEYRKKAKTHQKIESKTQKSEEISFVEKGDDFSEENNNEESNFSSIPDIFFDKIIIDYKLNRVEILVLMYIYRKVWCLPNLYKIHGISPVLSHAQMSKELSLTIEELYAALRKLEEMDFIKTIRSGQYFSRKFFSKELDETFHVNYDDMDF